MVSWRRLSSCAEGQPRASRPPPGTAGERRSPFVAMSPSNEDDLTWSLVGRVCTASLISRMSLDSSLCQSRWPTCVGRSRGGWAERASLAPSSASSNSGPGRERRRPPSRTHAARDLLARVASGENDLDLDLFEGEFVVLLGPRAAASRRCSTSSGGSTCHPGRRVRDHDSTGPTTRSSPTTAATTSASSSSSTTSSPASPRGRTWRSSPRSRAGR